MSRRELTLLNSRVNLLNAETDYAAKGDYKAGLNRALDIMRGTPAPKSLPVIDVETPVKEPVKPTQVAKKAPAKAPVKKTGGKK